jgi:hypothetical protein
MRKPIDSILWAGSFSQSDGGVLDLALLPFSPFLTLGTSIYAANAAPVAIPAWYQYGVGSKRNSIFPRGYHHSKETPWRFG